MFSFHKKGPVRANEYASAEDFCRIFKNEMTGLYCLALALTGDPDEAEQCFVGGLEECISGNAVFKEWARSWSKRVVIKKAVQLVRPPPGKNGLAAAAQTQGEPGSGAALVLAALGQLQPFDRFVFVMSVLEGYSVGECAALLACPASEVTKARIRAVEEIRSPRLTTSELGFQVPFEQAPQIPEVA
jgi:DNA-directed RNA polymerase specialized sigma24 family protein